MNCRIAVFAAFLIMVSMFAATGVVQAAPLDGIQFVMIASDEAKATIKKADGTLQVITVGDVIADTFMVRRIVPGRITLENRVADGPRAVLVWLKNGRQRVEPLGISPQQADKSGSP